MKAFSFDTDGFYVGEVNRQKSPLEPGVWLLPASSTDVQPPECQENEKAMWDGSEWIIVSLPELEQPITEPPRSAQELINDEALSYLAMTDWYIIREVDAGIPCPSEIRQQRALARSRIVREEVSAV